jgi:hypothetical protein
VLDYGDLLDMCDESAETIEALHKRLEWQPMETLPEEECYVLVACKGGNVCSTFFSPRLPEFRKKTPYVDNVSACFDAGLVYGHTIVGWMPLPEVE